jgi:hypothetical protein
VSPEQLAGWLVLFVAVLGALGYIARKVRAAVRVFDALEVLVQRVGDRADLAADRAHVAAEAADVTSVIVARELEGNHGSSMKDDVTAIAHVVGGLWGRIDDIDERLTRHLEGQRK